MSFTSSEEIRMDDTIHTYFERIPTVPVSPLNVEASDYVWYHQIIAFKCLLYVLYTEMPDLDWTDILEVFRNPLNVRLLKWLVVLICYRALKVFNIPVICYLMTLQKFHVDLPSIVQYPAVFYGSCSSLEFEIALDYYLLYIVIDTLMSRIITRDWIVLGDITNGFLFIWMGIKSTFITLILCLIFDFPAFLEDYPVIATYIVIAFCIFIRYQLCPHTTNISQCSYLLKLLTLE